MTKILRTYLKVWLFLLPIFFLPVVVDSFGFGKNWLMFLSMLIGLVLWVVGMVVNKDSKVVLGRGWGWLLVLTLWAVVWWWLGEAGVKMRSFMGVPGMGMMMSLVTWFFLRMQVSGEGDRGEENWLTVAGLLAAVTSLVVFLLPTAKMPISWPKQNPLVNITSDWSLAGSILGEMWLLGILGVLWTRKLLEKIKRREGYMGEMVVTAILVLVFFLDIFKMFRSGWNYLDINSSWTIATESLKRLPLRGVGTGNFVEAFNWWKPETFNMTRNWSGVFGWSASAGLQLWTELGLVGLAVAVLTVMGFIKSQGTKESKIGVTVLILILALTPINLVSLVLAAWLIVRNLKTREVGLTLKVGEEGFNAAPVMLAVVVLVASFFGAYWWTRVLLGEIYLKKSLVAAASNDGGATYSWQIKAISANPNSAEYRRIYSQTNLALAVGLMSNKDITDDQKQQAATLIQQSVREGKAAVSLDTGNASYWTNLAGIYRQLVGSVEGAADWSYEAYSQAAVLDPTNPSLRLDFGGLLFAAGNYDEASRLFEQVVTLKPDLANGWYNWAHAAKKLNRLGDAVTRLNQAVSLVPTTSGDYDIASKELETWKKEYDALVAQQKEAQTAKEAETLSVPKALPANTNNSNVEVPTEGLEPPAEEVVIPPLPAEETANPAPEETMNP